MDSVEIVKNELNLVRTDLRELKRCQLQYFTLSITGAGAILGIVAPLQGRIFQNLETNLAALALLAPLLILLPCWLIFFDKANTITRLVGYQRTLEDFLVDSAFKNGTYITHYIGLENALSIMREKEWELDAALDNPATQISLASIWNMIILRVRNRYWMINWYTFAALSFVSCTLGYNFLGVQVQTFIFPFGLGFMLPERTLWGGGAFLLFVIVSIYTMLQVRQLALGKRSYDAYADKWRKLLLQK